MPLGPRAAAAHVGWLPQGGGAPARAHLHVVRPRPSPSAAPAGRALTLLGPPRAIRIRQVDDLRQQVRILQAVGYGALDEPAPGANGGAAAAGAGPAAGAGTGDGAAPSSGGGASLEGLLLAKNRQAGGRARAGVAPDRRVRLALLVRYLALTPFAHTHTQALTCRPYQPHAHSHARAGPAPRTHTPGPHARPSPPRRLEHELTMARLAAAEREQQLEAAQAQVRGPRWGGGGRGSGGCQ